MASRFIGLAVIILMAFAICVIYSHADSGKTLRVKREIRPHFESRNSLHFQRFSRSTEDDDPNIVLVKDNPFVDEKIETEKNADQILAIPQAGFPSVHTRVVQPGFPIQTVPAVVGHGGGYIPQPGIVLESKRDRLRRLLNRLLGQKKGVPVAVPVPVPVVPGEDAIRGLDASSFEGSYVAVSGRPGERTVHIVNGRTGVELAGTITGPNARRKNRPFFDQDNNENFDYSPADYNGDVHDYGDYGYDYNDGSGLAGRRYPLKGDADPATGFLGRGRKRRYPPVPRCSYVNTDFYGDDVGDGKGLTASSAQECKTTCQREESCSFWTFRPGWARGCYLKRGRRGDPTPLNAIPREGYISGTKLDTCICLQNSANTEEQVCPINTSQYVYPWHRKRPNGFDGNVRFDYDDDDIRRRPAIDDALAPVEPVTLPPPVGIGNTVVGGGGNRKTRARTRAGLVENTTPRPLEEDKKKQVELL